MAEQTPPGKPVVNRRRIIIIGGVAVVVIVGYAYLRNRSSSSTAGVDPATGSTGATGYVNPNPDASGFDEVQSDDGLITTNAEWLEDVLAKFESRNIYDPAAAAIVLGAYLAGQEVTQEEAVVVRTAWGVSGYPPQNVQLHIKQSTGTPPPANTPPAKTPPATTPTPTPKTPKPGPPRRYVTTGVYGVTSPAWKNTLSGIAGRTGRTVPQLASWNGLANPNVIPRNSQLWIDPPGTYTGKTEFKG